MYEGLKLNAAITPFAVGELTQTDFSPLCALYIYNLVAKLLACKLTNNEAIIVAYEIGHETAYPFLS